MAPSNTAVEEPTMASTDNENLVLRCDRIEKGQCPSCGIQLYKPRKQNMLGKLVRKNKPPAQPKPLTNEQVFRGQCINCMGLGGMSVYTQEEEDAAIAEALILSELDYNEHVQSQSEEEEEADGEQEQQEEGEQEGESSSSPEEKEEEEATRSSPSASTQNSEENSAEGTAGPEEEHAEHECLENECIEDDLYDVPTIAAIPVPDEPQQVKHIDTATYEGEVNRLGARHGHGVLTWCNGDRYEGNFWNGVREGAGSIFFHNGGEYVGEWENNKMHGQGTQRFLNGDVYTGQFQRGQRSGQGRCYFANGDLYNGSWDDGHLNEYGVYYYSNGQCFQGFFMNNKREGRGKYQYRNGNVDVFWYENGNKLGNGVRWNANRRKAWKVTDTGKVIKRVSLEKADELVHRMEQRGR